MNSSSATDRSQLCTEAQASAIQNAKYKFCWRIVYADGEEVFQLAEDGSENKIEFLRPMREVSWLPTMPDLQSATVHLKAGDHIVLARRTTQMMNGTNYVLSYIIGVETLQPNGSLCRRVWFISPPAEGLRLVPPSPPDVHPTTQSDKFPGALEVVEDNYADFRSAAQVWVGDFKPVVIV